MELHNKENFMMHLPDTEPLFTEPSFP